MILFLSSNSSHEDKLGVLSATETWNSGFMNIFWDLDINHLLLEYFLFSILVRL